MQILFVGLFVFLVFSNETIGFQDDPNPEFTDQQLEFFESKVRPILVNRCHECHAGETTEGGLSLESRKAILAGGDTDAGIVPHKPDESLIIDAVNYGEYYEMPPSSKLPAEEIEILTEWVKQGAPWPQASDVEIKKTSEFDLDQRKNDHWCWHPVVRPSIPDVGNEWAKRPLDKFVFEQVQKAGLNVAEQADRETLLRRVCFDIIGLPPTSDQITRFVINKEVSLEQIVDELLASPRFGERWARHWMDLSRYAETCGHEFDYPIPNAFHYRDYLIRAFNADVPYDQFVIEHMAGDLLETPRRHPTDLFNESQLATGFWFLGEAKHGAVDARGEEARTFDNQIDVMSKSFLALTVACARCHDHKFDAISAKDFYALAGFLQSSRREVAMIDYGRKIETAYNDVYPTIQESSQLLSQLKSSLAQGDKQLLASYLRSAVEVVRSDPKWFVDAPVTVQGEAMKTVESTSGKVETQHIGRNHPHFKWQGERQTWWREAKAGDTWTLEFELPKSGQFEVAVSMTIAQDYGAANIFLDDKQVGRRHEFYSENPGNQLLSLGQHDLESGKHRIRFQLLEPNEKAIARNMIGLDFLEAKQVVNADSIPARVTPEKLASERGLDADLVTRMAEAIQSPATSKRTHPLYSISQLLDGKKELNANAFNNIVVGSRNMILEAEKTRKDAVRFTGFDASDWKATGIAFGENGDSERPYSLLVDSPLDVIPSGVVSSANAGGNYFGVLRSPGFEITHNNIHLRMKSKSANLRLVIEGFTMNEYNGLLYNGCFQRNVNHAEFEWQTQGADIRNFIGSRAHLEIIDHGNGFAAIDEIWFSDGGAPRDFPSELARELMERPAADLDEYCSQVAQQLIAGLESDEEKMDRDAAHTLSWVLQGQLAAAFGNQSNTATSGASSSMLLQDQLLGNYRGLLERAGKVPHPQLAQAMTDGYSEDEFIHVRGNHKTLGKRAPRQFLEAIVADDSQRFSGLSGSGRLELASQMVAAENPLTSRVIVNRVWHHLTGQGIVASVDNFGVLGAKPTNQPLLDYLAAEFVDDGWSVKRLIKRIVLSSTYQMASTLNPAATDIDPDNNLLHRARIRRLQGEVIRDAMLAASGELNLKMYGPSVAIHLTPFMQGRGRPGRNGPVDGDGRRSVYLEVRRNFLSPMMLAFDTPIPFNAIGRRNQSNVPAQALILMNDPFVVGQATKWAEKLIASHETREARVEAMYQSAFGRRPTQAEITKAMAFVESQSKELGSDENHVEIWRDLCHVMFNVKEFIYLK